jgi:hypothetical protein
VSAHLTPELVFGYEHNLLSGVELRSVHEHVQECAKCRERLAQSMDIEGMLSAAEEPLRRDHLSKTGVYAAAAAIVLAAGLSGWFWLKARPKQPTAVHVDLPAFIQDLNPPHQILMGDPAASAAQGMSPQGTAVIGARPIFQWPRQAGDGWTYKVQIFGPGSKPVLESAEIQTTEWRPDRDLASAVNYQWQVTAVRGNQRLTLPGPPSTPPRFRVVAPETAERIDQLAARGASRLELASAYAQAGLLDDARRQLDAAIHDHPDDPKLRQLRDRLH